MGRKAKIPSAKPIWNGFLLVTVRVLNSYTRKYKDGEEDFMGPIFEGDGWFCVIAIIVSELLADIPWLSAQMRLPGIVMISLIFALFYGPEPKRISKKVFVGGVVGLMAASLLGELVGNFIGKGI